MVNEQYYRLELDEVAAPSFTSFGKYYYGTMDQLRKFIKALEDADYIGDHSKELIVAFHAYEAGQTDARHSVAYHDVPLLVPVTILHEEAHRMTDFAWVHMNIWEWPQNMRCKSVETKHLWIQDGDCYCRALFAFFTGLEHQGITKEWHKVGEMLWGYPEMLDYNIPHIQNRLAEVELTFAEVEDLEADWEAFRKSPTPVFSAFCDDIFGDG